jgi:hypothetical protein
MGPTRFRLVAQYGEGSTTGDRRNGRKAITANDESYAMKRAA